MNQLDKSKCDKSGLSLDEAGRCDKVVGDSKSLGVETVITGKDINSVRL